MERQFADKDRRELATSRQDHLRSAYKEKARRDKEKCDDIVQATGALGPSIQCSFRELQQLISGKFSDEYGKGVFKGGRATLEEKKWKFMLCVFEAIAFGGNGRIAATIHIINPQNGLPLKEKREKRKFDSWDSPVVKSSEDLLDELLQAIPDGHFCNLSPPPPSHTDNGPAPMNVLSLPLPSLSDELQQRVMQIGLVVQASLHLIKNGQQHGPIALLDPTTGSGEHRFSKFNSLLKTKLDLLALAIEQQELWDLMTFYDLEQLCCEDTIVQLRAHEGLLGIPGDFRWDLDCSRFLSQFLPQNGTLLLYVEMDAMDNLATSIVSITNFPPSSGSPDDSSSKDGSSGFDSPSLGGSPGTKSGLSLNAGSAGSSAESPSVGGVCARPILSDDDSTAIPTAIYDSLMFWATLLLFLQYSTEIGTLWGRLGYELSHVSTNGTSCLEANASSEPLVALSSFQCGFNILLFVPILILLYVYQENVGNDGRRATAFLRKMRVCEIAIVILLALLTLLNFVISCDLLVIGNSTYLGYDYRVQFFKDLFGYTNIFLLIKLLANFRRRRSPFIDFFICWNISTETLLYLVHAVFASGIFSRQAVLFQACPNDLSAQHYVMSTTTVLMSKAAMLELILVVECFDMIWAGEALDTVRPCDKIVWFFAGLFNIVRHLLCKLLFWLTCRADCWFSTNLCMKTLMRFFYFSQITTWALANLISSSPARKDYLDESIDLVLGCVQLTINVFILLVTYLHHYNVEKQARAKWYEWLWNTTPVDCRHHLVEVGVKGNEGAAGSVRRVNPCACKNSANFFYRGENAMKSRIAGLVFVALNAILIARACILEESQFALQIPLMFTTYACMFVTFPHLQVTPSGEDPDFAGDNLLWKLHFVYTLLVLGADVVGMTAPSHFGSNRSNLRADNILHFFQHVTESILSVKLLLMLLWNSQDAAPGYVRSPTHVSSRL